MNANNPHPGFGNIPTLAPPAEHVWQVVARIKCNVTPQEDGRWSDAGPALLVQCDCGRLGIVDDPSELECQRAGIGRPYRWPESQRVRELFASSMKGVIDDE